MGALNKFMDLFAGDFSRRRRQLRIIVGYDTLPLLIFSKPVAIFGEVIVQFGKFRTEFLHVIQRGIGGKRIGQSE